MQSVPLLAKDQTLGILAAAFPPHRHVSRRDRHLLDNIGRHLGEAIENAWQYERMHHDANRFAAINAVGDAIRSSLRVPRLLHKTLHELLVGTNLDFAVAYLCEQGSLAVAAREGASRHQVDALAQRTLSAWKRGSRRRLAATQPVVEENLLASGQPVERLRPARTPRCLMHIPLCSREHLLGFLVVGSYTQAHFAPDATILLGEIGRQVALTLDNARLYEQNALLYREARKQAVELVQTNQALREAVRGKDQFLANVTHELKRPLAPARMVLETMLETPTEGLSPRRRDELLRNALTNLDNLERLVSELLEAVRIERRTQLAATEVVDLRAVAQRSLAAMQPLAKARGLKVHSIIPPKAVNVRGDAGALAKVVENLLSNAIKFNKETGSILLQLEQAVDGQAVLSVTDTGVGIPKHARPHIFERFFQADGSSTRAHEGLGLGLYIVKEIVEQHNGSIRFDTEEGSGTTFTITLPVA